MNIITFDIGRSRKQAKYLCSIEEDHLLNQYFYAIKQMKLPNLLECREIEVPNYLVGAYRAKGFNVENHNKNCGKYEATVIPELIFQVVESRNKELEWERYNGL